MQSSKTPVHLKTCLWYEDESIHTANILIKLSDEMILSDTKESQDMQLEHKGGAWEALEQENSLF